jgi:hypothetical protein
MEDCPDWVKTERFDVWQMVTERLDRLEENRHLAVDPSEGPRNWNLGHAIAEGIIGGALAVKILSIGELTGGKEILERYKPKEEHRPSRQEVHDFCKAVSNFMFNSSQFRERVARYWTEFVEAKIAQREAIMAQIVPKQNDITRDVLVAELDNLNRDINTYRYYPDRVTGGMHDSYLREDPSLSDSSSSPRKESKRRDKSPSRTKRSKSPVVSSPDYQVY